MTVEPILISKVVVVVVDTIEWPIEWEALGAEGGCPTEILLDQQLLQQMKQLTVDLVKRERISRRLRFLVRCCRRAGCCYCC